MHALKYYMAPLNMYDFYVSICQLKINFKKLKNKLTLHLKNQFHRKHSFLELNCFQQKATPLI